MAVFQKIGEALEAALLRCGFEAKCNRTVSISQGVAASNAWGADWHICLHTNAFDGTVAGTRLFHSGKDEPAKACQAILNRLAPITPGSSDNITARSGLYEVGAVNAWTVYVESGFHDNPTESQWLIDHTADVAEAVCQGMCDHLGVAYVAPAAACKEGNWYSATTREGLWHKAGMIVAVICAAVADMVISIICTYILQNMLQISWPAVLLPLVLAWYIITELGSILENAVKLGATVPDWLVKLLKVGLKAVHKAAGGETPAENKTG